MRALIAVRQPKRCVTFGPWSVAKMPDKAFPLSRGKGYRLGVNWRWCVCQLEGDTHCYRLLVAFNVAKAQYLAWLGLCDGADQALIARLEYNPDHRGWHCHYKRGPLAAVTRGVVKEAGAHESFRICRTDKPFSISEMDGIGVAFRVFSVTTDDGGGTGLFQ